LSVNAGERPLRALRANPVFGADEKRIRTQSVIRADGSPSAQDGPLQCELPPCIKVPLYKDLCVPSQKGGDCVRLHPHSAFFSDCATVNFTGVNAPPLCEPSQNGCFFDWPQAHHQ